MHYYLYSRIFYILMLARTGNTGNAPVLRHNYGVLFEPQVQTKNIIHDYIDFEMSLKVSLKFHDYTCSRGNATLALGLKLSSLNEELALLTNLIQQMSTGGRHKRALLLIGGKILKAVFGVETEEQTQKLKSILQILDRTIHNDKHYQVDRDTLIAKLAHSHHLLIRLTKIHVKEAQSLFSGQMDDISNLNKFNSKLLGTLVVDNEVKDCLWKIMQTEMHFKYLLDLIYAINRLGDGFLSRELIPSNKLLNLMDTWDMILFRNYSLNLAFSSIHYYYSNEIVKKFMIIDDQVNYVLKIAATHNSPKFKLYKIIKFDVPSMTHNSSIEGYTSLKDKSKFLLYNDTHYSTDMHGLNDNRPKVYLSVNYTNCVLAIFRDLGYDIIRNHCVFSYHAHTVPDFKHVRVSDTMHILITNENVGVIECDNKNDTGIQLASMSILELPCNCNLRTNSYVLSSDTFVCEFESNFTLNTGVNLPLFQSIDIDVANFKGGDLIKLDIPKLHELHVNFSRQIKILDLEENYVTDIIRKAERQIQLDKKYQQPAYNWAAHIVYDYGPVASSFVLSIVSLSISLYLLYRIHGLFAILVGFKSALGANVTLTQWKSPDFHEIDSFLRNLSRVNTAADSDFPDAFNSTMTSDDDTSMTTYLAIGFYVVVTILGLVCVYKIVKCMYKCRTTWYHIMGPADTKVYLKIKYQGDVYAFQVCQVLHNISAITMPNPPSIIHIRSPRFCSRRLEIKWDQMSICEYFANGRLVSTLFPGRLEVPRGCREQVRVAIQSGAFHATLIMADAHGNTISLRTDAMKKARGIPDE